MSTAMSNATDDPSFGIPHSTINQQSALDNQHCIRPFDNKSAFSNRQSAILFGL
jgi:hypothetical protein